MNVPEHPSSVGEPAPGGAFGPNAWLVDDMYDQFRRDPASVSESWREFFADYVPGGHGGLAGSGSPPDGQALLEELDGGGNRVATASNGASSNGSTLTAPIANGALAGQIPVVSEPEA